MPSFFILALHWYAPSVVAAVFYLPALMGMYMMLLHTVVNGWRRRHKHRDIIVTSQMRFQGRQAVRNMLAMTLRIAGVYFAAFYAMILYFNDNRFPPGEIAGMGACAAVFSSFLWYFAACTALPGEASAAVWVF